MCCKRVNVLYDFPHMNMDTNKCAECTLANANAISRMYILTECLIFKCGTFWACFPFSRLILFRAGLYSMQVCE